MATDDSSDGSGAGRAPEPGDDTEKKSDEQGSPGQFVDRDDDFGSVHIDADYEEGFPPDDSVTGSDGPDPGYTAFAEDLDDPLADWPSPDSRLEDLPEVQLGKAAAEVPNASEPAGNPPIDFMTDDDSPELLSDDETISDDDGWPDSDDRVPAEPESELEPEADRSLQNEEFPEAEFFDDPLEDESSEDDAMTTGFADAAPAGDLDRDLAPEPEPPASFGAPEPEAVDRDEEPAPFETDGLEETGLEPPHREREMVEHTPEPEPMTALDFDGEDEEALVDDFLNDLDDDEDLENERRDRPLPEEGLAAAIAEEADARTDSAAAAAVTGAAAVGLSTVERSAPADVLAAGSASREARTPQRGADDGARGLPWAMIAVVILALILLAAGGYGVIMQRSSLEAEIRDLQAQLATAMPPEEAAAERERQRQTALQNEALAAEVEGLQAENAALAEQVASLETQVAERRAAEAQERERAAAAAREAEAAAQKAAAARAAPPAPAPAAKPAGAWFVNFGSYAQRNVAERWAAQLTVDEGKVVVQQATAAGKSLYRVRVIGLPSQDRAERVATALERQHQLPRLWVGKD